METITNKVADSGIITLDLSVYIPADDSIVLFDLKPYLFQGMILREKDYRAALQGADWQHYGGKHVAVYCTADAIIPLWAYMLAASYLQPAAASVYYGTTEELKKETLLKNIGHINANDYADKRVVIKGCGDIAVPEAAYVAVTQVLRPVAKSIMYGEPCSTVPVYKKPSRIAGEG